ncbi:MAG TPA: PaaI family thioesterase [Alphaproteobacteria bacterium]|nr:PaaI family thioesterase [Alphaproteobacteria bacterium]
MDPMSVNPPPGFHPFEPERYFYNAVGPMFIRYMDGRVNYGFRVMEKHCNAGGICHGGMLFTVMDIQLGIGANVDTGRNGFMVTVNATTDFVAQARLGQWVEASNSVVRETRSLIFNEGRMVADGEVVLRANAILKVPRQMGDFDTLGMLPPEYRGEAG